MAGGLFLSYCSLNQTAYPTVEWAESDCKGCQPPILPGCRLLAGLLIANLLSPVWPVASGRTVHSGTGKCPLGYIGMNVAVKERRALGFSAIDPTSRPKIKRQQHSWKASGDYDDSAKVLDTSVIIDGRIADVAKSGFLEGPLVILLLFWELRHIADSSDVLKETEDGAV